jgi:hypothetical protein
VIAMKKTKLIVVVISLVVVLSFISFTYISAKEEPKAPSKEPFYYVTRNHPYPSPVFSKSFELLGINGTFNFQFYGDYNTFFIPQLGYDLTPMWINVTKTHQNGDFGLGNMSLLIDEVNLSQDYGSQRLLVTNCSISGKNLHQVPVHPYLSISVPFNNTGFSSFFFGIDLGDYIVGNSTNVSSIFTHIPGYNVSISIEVTPYVEFGPYFSLGKPVWVIYSYEFM